MIINLPCRLTRRIGLGFLIAVFGHSIVAIASGSQTRADELPTIISASLCADQYLLTFAAPSQILALSTMAQDKSLSPMADKAANYPIFSGSLEHAITSPADIIIVSAYTSKTRRDALVNIGKHVITLDGAQTWENSRQEALALGKAIGREASAKVWVSETDAALQSIKSNKHRYNIMSYDRGGVVSGRGHILNDLIERSGHTNPAAAMFGGSQPLSLETLISLKPDFIILANSNTPTPGKANIGNDGGNDGGNDRGQEAMFHPAFLTAFPQEKRIRIPQNLLFCAGPSFMRALQILQAGIDAKTTTK